MSRFPSWVYDAGGEPDPRFSLANERTLLAWIRTGLGLFALGAASLAVDLGLDGPEQVVVVAALALAGGVAIGLGWASWALTERRLRLQEPLPGAGVTALLTGVIVVAVLAVTVTAWAAA